MSYTTADLEDSIKASLTTITRHWDSLLALATPSGTGHGGSRGTLITADDHADTDHDVDCTTRIVSLRRFTTDVLNGWSRVVMEDRPIKVALPDGASVPSMAKFLDTHARWMSGHEAADDCRDELADVARRIRTMAAPTRREWFPMGNCPIEVEFDPARGVEVCAGDVRAWPKAEDRDGEVMGKCLRCGTEAVASWWERQMFTDPELRQWLTDAELVPFLHSTFGIVVKEATIRQWVRRDVLKPSGNDDRGRRLFNREAVVYAIDLKIKREQVGT